MCQRQQPSGFHEQEIKAQCESRIFNKLLPEISFRIALWCFHFGAKMEIKVVSGAALTSRKKLFQIQLKFAQAFPHLPKITTTNIFWLLKYCSSRKRMGNKDWKMLEKIYVELILLSDFDVFYHKMFVSYISNMGIFCCLWIFGWYWNSLVS